MEKSNALTLIELVVVILIINLLAAVSLPALNRSSEQARRAACSGNLKALGVANYAYAADHNDWFVPFAYQDADDIWQTWPTNKAFRAYLQIDSYMKDKKGVDVSPYDVPDEFLCPSDKVSTDPRNKLAGVLLSYGYNYTDWQPFGSWWPPRAEIAGYKTSDVNQPAETMTFIDSIDWWVWWGAADYRIGWDILGQQNIRAYQRAGIHGPTIYRHSEGANVAFYDGHVEWMRKQEIFVVDDWDASPQRPGMWSNYDTYPPPQE